MVALASWASRIVQVVSQLLMITYLTRILAVEQYAVYVLLTSLMTWYMLIDLGLGFSLQNTISEMRSHKKNYHNYIATAFLAVLCLLLVFILCFYFLSSLISFYFLENFDVVENKGDLFFISASLMMGAAAFNIIYKVWYAIGLGYLSSIVPAIASVISLLGLYILATYYSGEMSLYLALIVYLTPIMVLPAMFFIIILYKNIKGFFIDRDVFNYLFGRGVGFFVFSMMAAIVLQIDYIIMSQMLESIDIVLYSVVTKYFALGLFVYNALLLALWPVIAEKISKGHWADVAGYLKTYIPMGMVFMVLFTFVSVFVLEDVTQMLIKNTKLDIPVLLILVFGVYYLLRVWTDTFAMVLQSMSNLKPLWTIVPIQAVLSVILQVYFTNIYGIYGILYGLIVSFALTVSWYLPKKVYYCLKGEVNV